MKRTIVALVMTALFVLLLTLSAFAGVTLMWADTSGSMNKEGRFESAKDVLIREISNAKPGDILYVGNFDSNDYIIGRLAVGEAGSPAEKESLIARVRSLSAKGQWTNLDQPLKASKAVMIDERAVGKIVLLSDGLSDPSPDHQPVDLAKIAEIVPQKLGWSLYLIGLSQDIEGLFQAKSPEKELTVNEQYPHVKGIALNEFTHEKIEDAVDAVKKDEEETAAKNGAAAQQEGPTVPAPWPAILTALLLGAVSVPLLLVHKSRTRKKLALVFEVRGTDGESKDLQVAIEDGKKKTVGPKGEITVEAGNMELPPVLFKIHWKKEVLWLLPQDSITVNGKLASDKVGIGIGDLIKVRDKVSINIKEGGDDVTEQ
jgi:hypothetical protein